MVSLKAKSHLVLCPAATTNSKVPAREFGMWREKWLLSSECQGPYCFISAHCKVSWSHMGDVLLPSCKGSICRTENTPNHNTFLVIAEWEAHEIFKTWSGDFILKHFNCQNRAVESLSELGDEQQLGAKWRKGEKKKKRTAIPPENRCLQMTKRNWGFLAESCFVSCISFGAVKMRHVLYCMFFQKSQTNQPPWFQGSKASPFSCFNYAASTWAGDRIIYHKSLSDRYLAGSQNPGLCNNVQYGKFLRWNPDFVT